MAPAVIAARPAQPALPGPYGQAPSPDRLAPSPATVGLVREQVQALLLSSPSFAQMAPPRRRTIAHEMVKIAAYAAECVRDDWYQSQRLGQRPLVVREQAAPVAEAQQGTGSEFVAGAANQIGSVTRQTLDAIAFPTFVAELIRGTFNAITDASIKQMESYGRLLGDVGRTVDDFMNQNISDNQARDWLVQQYPNFLRIERSSSGSRPRPGRPARPARAGRAREEEATLAPVEGAEGRPLPNWSADLGVPGRSSLDASWLEEKLLPAARRKLAQTRLQTLSTLVLMGMNRISVTGGKLRATMAFHIDTSDIANEQHASDLDLRTAASGQAGFGPWSASASVSFAYVTSNRSSAESEMNVGADLTSEVEIHFKSDPFPLERMAGPSALGRIVANTPVPEANTATSSSGGAIPWGAPVERAAVPTRTRTPLPAMTPAGSALPAAPQPAAPAAQPTPPPRPAAPEGASGGGGSAAAPATPPAGGGSGGGGSAAPATPPAGGGSGGSGAGNGGGSEGGEG